MIYRDDSGAWVRPMEQRFRALAQGAISVNTFLDPDITVDLDRDGLCSLSYISPLGLEALERVFHGDDGLGADATPDVLDFEVRRGGLE